MKPCPTCLRTGTIHRYDMPTCLVCDPPTPEELSWKTFSFAGQTWSVVGRDWPLVKNFLERAKLREMVRYGKKVKVAFVKEDTGLCGQDALVDIFRTPAGWMALFGAQLTE